MQVLDKLILILLCFGGSLFTSFDITFIASFLFALSLTALIYVLPHTKYPSIITLVYGICILPFGWLLLFLPVLAYDMFKYKCYGSMLFSIIGILMHISSYPPTLNYYIIIGCLISFVFQYKSSRLIKLHNEFRTLRDDSTEHTILMQQKNAALIEAQNYEILNATLEERHRIAREIHDNVGHLLSRSILMTGALKMTTKNTDLGEPIEQLETTLSYAMDNIRSSVHDLHDDSINLQITLETLCRDFLTAHCSLDYELSATISRDIKYCFIAIVKEALNNITKHSNATEVSIFTKEHSSMYQLSIHDNGSVKPPPLFSSDSGIGLFNMKERVRALNGTIKFSWNDGFQIFISIPKKETLK